MDVYGRLREILLQVLSVEIFVKYFICRGVLFSWGLIETDSIYYELWRGKGITYLYVV